jgi:hypothetical protein
VLKGFRYEPLLPLEPAIPLAGRTEELFTQKTLPGWATRRGIPRIEIPFENPLGKLDIGISIS